MKHMRMLSLLALLALFTIGIVLVAQYRASAAPMSKKPLTLVFKNLDGKEVKLADYRGKVVILDVWATWCGYCVREIPDLVKLQQEMTEKKRNVQIIGVSVDRRASDVRDFVKKHEINYPIVLSDMNALKPLGDIPGIPVKVVLNDKGVIVEKRIGAMEADDLKKLVEKYAKDEKDK